MKGRPTKVMPFDVARMERDILEEVHNCREGIWRARDSKTILKRHGSDAHDRLNVVIEYLIDEGFLIPLYIPGEKTSTNWGERNHAKGVEKIAGNPTPGSHMAESKLVSDGSRYSRNSRWNRLHNQRLG